MESPRHDRSTPSVDAVNGRPVKIQIADLVKTYRTEGGSELPVLRGVNAEVYDQEFVSLIGPSGCGKTTLLNIIAGLVPPTGGRVLVDGRAVTGPGRERGMVFQQDALLLWRRVLGNVEYGLELRGVPRAERRRIALDYLKLVGLERFANFYPKELSGGMKKRVQIAAVFANNPVVLLMDEPFGALDYPTKVALQEELLAIWSSQAKTTVFVTHDVEEALFLSDRVLIMARGTIDQVVEVPFPRPRSHDLRVTAEFHDLKRELWNRLI